MNFKYHALTDKLTEKIHINLDTVYVVDNYTDKSILENQYKKDMFKQNPMFLTFSELKEKLFLTDRFLLKEEKRTLLLYKAIPNYVKDKLKFKNYYDFIDYGENLLKFLRELTAYKIKDLGKLELWQKESYETIKIIYENFYKLLDEYNYIVPELLENMNYFDMAFIKDYKNIEFVNLFSFTEIEKDMIKALDKSFSLNFNLKMDKDSFDEAKLEFLGLNLDKNLKFSGEVFEVKDKFETMINLVNEISKDNTYKIYSCDFENNKINDLVSQNFINKKENPKFEESKLYKFLEIIGKILESKEIINGKKVYKIHQIFLALENKDLCRYFKINSYLIKTLEEIFLKDEYKYLNLNIIENHYKKPENIEGIQNLFDFIDRLYQMKTLKNFTEFLSTELNFKTFGEEKYQNLFDKYFEALTEIESNEMLKIDFNFKEIFDKNSLTESLFKLILKYLKAKPIDYLTLKSTVTTIENFHETISLEGDKVIIIDISNETYPQKPKAQFLLNNKQKKNLGLPHIEKDKELMRYNFFNRISNMENVKIFSLKNAEQNIDSSSFVDELILNFGISKTESVYNSQDLSALVKKIFDSENFIKSQIVGKDKIPKTNKELGEIYYFGAYDYNDSSKCLYKFFLNSVNRLDFINREIDYDFENRTMGIIVHSLYEKAFVEYKKSIITGDFVVSKTKIHEIFENIHRDNIYKIPKELNQYFTEILMPHYEESLITFFSVLSKELNDSKLESFIEEKNNEKILLKEDINLGIRGRADLVMETGENKYIIDIKTGASIDSQLNFYELLYFGEGNSAKKYIYNAWDKKLDEKDKTLSMDEFKMTLKEFLSKEFYERAEKTGTCRNCKYQNICRMRWDNE